MINQKARSVSSLVSESLETKVQEDFDNKLYTANLNESPVYLLYPELEGIITIVKPSRASLTYEKME